MATNSKRTKSISTESVIDERLIVEKTLLPPNGTTPTTNGGANVGGLMFTNPTTGQLWVSKVVSNVLTWVEKGSGGGGGAVSSVNGQVGDVVLTKADIGLNNVDNTSDLSKPISTATQNALDLKQNSLSGTGFVKSTGGVISYDNSSYVPYTGATTDVNLGTNTLTCNSVTYNPIASPSYQRGKVFYDQSSESLTYYDDISGTAVNLGQENNLRARNSTGSTILNGQVVYITGATGQNPTIGLARADSLLTCEVVGIATHDIPNNTIGKVTTFGLVNDVDTSAFTEGDSLYLSSTTNGDLTNVIPSSPNFSVHLGRIVYSHAVNGKILVHIDRALTLDVTLSTGGNSIPPSVSAVKAYADTKATLTSFTASSPLSYNNTTGQFTIQQATTSQDGYLSSTDWNTFNSKGNGTVTSVSVVSANGLAGTVATATTTPAITLSTTITGLLKGDGTAISAATPGADYEPALTFSTGLTRSTNTITNDLSTGVSGGQSVIGGTASSNNLTLSSTSNAVKGKILFGTSAYDEVNNRLGINTSTPADRVDIVGSAGTSNVSVSNTSSATGELVTITLKSYDGIATSSCGIVGATNNSYSGFADYGSRNFVIQGNTGLKLLSGSNIEFYSGGVQAGQKRMLISSTGNTFVGGGSAPTAILHLAAGSATANKAPLKLTSGTNLTTPEAGAVEFDGTNYFVTTGTTRYTLAKTLTATATLDFPSTAAQSNSDLTIALTGAALGDIVLLGTPNDSVTANTCWTAFVSAADTVTVRHNNYGAVASDPASGTFRVSILKY